MAVVLSNSKPLRHIKVYSEKTFDLGISTCTLPERITPVEKFLASKAKQEQERSQRVGELCNQIDRLDEFELDYRDKCGAKRLIELTDANYSPKTYIKFVQELSTRYQKQSIELWKNNKVRKNISVFWNKKDGSGIFDNAGNYLDSYKELERCHKLEKLFFEKDNKGKYVFAQRIPQKSVENKSYWIYKSPETRQAFLEQAERLGLTKNAEHKKSTVEITPHEYDDQYDSNRYQDEEL